MRPVRIGKVVAWPLAAAVAVALFAACTTTEAIPATEKPSVAALGTDSRVTARPTPAPSASAVVVPLPDGGNTMFPGTYATKFDPSLTITINNLVDLDCAPGYRCRGDVDVNLPQWLGLEFGNLHGAELDVMRIDQVFARNGTSPVDPPKDLGAWLASRPGVRTLAGPSPVTVGGVSGTQRDLEADHMDPIGPTPFIDPLDGPVGPGGPLPQGTPFRLVALKVAGHWLLIVEGLGPENTARSFDAVVGGLEPVVNSIVWN